MADLMLIKSADFNGIQLDCYIENGQQDKGNFYAAREQIGRLLEYSEPDVAVRKIHMRHSERLDKFSTSTKLVRVEGEREVVRKVTVYSFKGLLEICRYSKQPKADIVMDWLFDVADEIRRTGSYSLHNNPLKLPDSIGLFKAAEAIVHKAVRCKTDRDFQEVYALDKVFAKMYGHSALNLAEIQLTTERR